MFNFLGKLFGSEKAIEKTIDTVSKGLDKLIYTDEEKADQAAAERTEARQSLIGWFNASSGQNLARRFIAISFTVSFLLLIFLGAGTEIAAIWVIDEAQRLHDTSKVILTFAQEIGDSLWIILGFYFAAPHMSDMTKAIIEKKTKGFK